MAHFAKVDQGRVIKVIVAEPEFFNTFIDTIPGDWIQTSYNTHRGIHLNGGTPLRGNFAGVGMVYDKEHDVFYLPKPFDSWTLNTTTWTWEPPTPRPEDDGKVYSWNESTRSWDTPE
jgi:hypothetical protein